MLPDSPFPSIRTAGEKYCNMAPRVSGSEPNRATAFGSGVARDNQRMPELPEVETIARELNARIVGRRIELARLGRNDIVRKEPSSGLAVALIDRRVQSVRRRAKRILIELDPPGTLVIHLGMSGRLTVEPADDPVLPHTHLRVPLSRVGPSVALSANGHLAASESSRGPIAVLSRRGRRWAAERSRGHHPAAQGTSPPAFIDAAGNEVDSSIELRFRDPRRFGGIWFFDGDEEIVGDRLAAVGEEPLSLSPKRFRALLERPRQIKVLLLDQSVIAGLGNIYTDEALFAAGIHPLTRSSRLDEGSRNRLLTHIKRILRRAIRHRGTTFMDYRTAGGDEGSFQRLHRVYHREGQPCRRCGGVIVRIHAAGRSSFLCPTCQRPRIVRRRSAAGRR